jgi:hypothetical protein
MLVEVVDVDDEPRIARRSSGFSRHDDKSHGVRGSDPAGTADHLKLGRFAV